MEKEKCDKGGEHIWGDVELHQKFAGYGSFLIFETERTYIYTTQTCQKCGTVKKV